MASGGEGLVWVGLITLRSDSGLGSSERDGPSEESICIGKRTGEWGRDRSGGDESEKAKLLSTIAKYLSCWKGRWDQGPKGYWKTLFGRGAKQAVQHNEPSYS